MIRPHIALQIKAALEAEGKEVPQHILAALEPEFKIPKKRLITTMYLLGASLGQIGRLAEMQRATAYHYIRDELKGDMPKRIGMGVKGKKNTAMISDDQAEIYWTWLQINQKPGYSAQQLAAFAQRGVNEDRNALSDLHEDSEIQDPYGGDVPGRRISGDPEAASSSEKQSDAGGQ